MIIAKAAVELELTLWAPLSPLFLHPAYSGFLFLPSWETLESCLGFPSLYHSLEMLQAASWDNCRTYLVYLSLQGLLFCVACCPVSRNHCFIYFVQFLSCLQWVVNLVLITPS